jgi:phosphoribosyl-ATP pyrophosphohydrolase/phosphoribosyl-AMP cyclohydrolase
MLKFDDKGLIPTIIQNADTGKVLMLGYINEESLKITLKTGKVCFYSRSRRQLWQKGETSGNYLNVRSIDIDCDEDTLLIKVDPIGPTCHTGAESCFYRTLDSIQ